jgi:peptide/nickel transport system substrate-binding protein
MKHSGWQWFAVSSLLLGAWAAAETRPQYGGTLHVTTHIAASSLDPSDNSQPDSIARRNLLRLMFDTLVTVDDRGRVQPALAASWRAEPGNQRWQFWLRRGTRFHDDSPLTPQAVAACLRAANPDWKVLASTDSVIVERDTPAPDFPFELARIRNAIVKRTPRTTFVGTGPFRIVDWQPGVKLTLAAEEGCWSGRPFVDAIEIEMGKSPREQRIALELGKVEIAEIAPEQAHRAPGEITRVVSSAPAELLTLVFSRGRQSSDDGKLRDALALSVDRASIRTVVLQDTGEPTGAVLPNWISGYAFVFPAEQNLTRARQERSELQRAGPWTLGYDADDALARVMAERVALNARDAGIVLQTTTSSPADLRFARIDLASVNPRTALAAVASGLGMAGPNNGGASVEDLYQAENGILQAQRLIPLFQLPVSYALSPTVRGSNMSPDGNWHLANVWLEVSKP